MRIQLLPFQYVLGITDIATDEVFVASRLDNFLPTVLHELAHILSGQPDHTKQYRKCLEQLGGQQPPDTDIFKRLRRRLGITSSIAANVGNVTGIQNILTDLHLLAAYRKFSKRVLATEGYWEVANEVDGPSSAQLLRLYPTPKGAFPVVVQYFPTIQHFRSPQAKKIACDMMVAEAKCMLGAARRKISGIPTPDGGSIQYDGESLVQEGNQEREKCVQEAILLGEPLHPYLI